MAIIRCDKGHYYDNTKFSQCPHCGVLPVMEKEKENGRNNHQPVVKTKAKSKSKLFSLFHRGEEKRQEPSVQQESLMQEDDSTIAMAEGVPFEEDDCTVAMPAPQESSAFDEDEDHTIAMDAVNQAQTYDEDDDRTIAMPSSSEPMYEDEDDDRTIAIPRSSQPMYEDEDDDRTIAIPRSSQPMYEDEDDDRTIAIPSSSQPMYEDEDDDRTIAIPRSSEPMYEDEDDDRTIAIPRSSEPMYEDEDDDRTIAIPRSSEPMYEDEDDDRTIAIPRSSQPMYEDEDDDRTIAIPSSASQAVSSGLGVSREQKKAEEPAASVSEQRIKDCRIQQEAPLQPQFEAQKNPAQMQAGFVVGWLVCINGVQKGRDYRLCRGFNRLGGSDKMDIAVKGDSKLGAFVSCAIVYDDKSNEFFAVKQEDEHVFLNEESLKGAVKLTSGDRIKAGDSEFEFVAFCREGRLWDSYE